MAKKVSKIVKLQVVAGKANPAPPVGPALGQAGVNIMGFCKEFNERTKTEAGMIIPVVITVYADRTFTFITKTPPAAVLIKKAGNPGPDETHLANLPGTVLGILDTYTILFDGKGSAFPVAITNNPGGLLWSVDCDFDDPTTDRFNDCVSINLNSAHKDYKYINPSDKAFNPAFMREVLAGAISTIVDCVRETDFWDDIRNGNVEEESVGQAIYYFSKTLDLNLEDARQCSISFREYFEQKLGEL